MQKIRLILVNFISFLLVFCGVFVLVGAYWCQNTLGDVDFNAIVFHLQFPLLGNGVPFVVEFILQVLLPSIIIALIITYASFVVRIISKIFQKSKEFAKAFYQSCLKKPNITKIAIAVALFALCLNATNNKLKITKYLKAQMNYSQLYEEHYKAFDAANLADFKPTQNLIIIIAESMESTFSGVNSPKLRGGGATPAINSPANSSQI